MVSPVAGSGIGSTCTSPVRDSRNAPPMKLCTCVAVTWRSSFFGVGTSTGWRVRRSRFLEPASADELAGPLLAMPFTVLDQDISSLDDDLGEPPHLESFVARVVDVHVVVARRDDPLVVRVEHHDVGVEPGRDGSLPGIEAEHLCGSGGDQLHEPGQGDLSSAHTLKDQSEPVLDSRQAVGDLGEIADAEVLLPLVI